MGSRNEEKAQYVNKMNIGVHLFFFVDFRYRQLNDMTD